MYIPVVGGAGSAVVCFFSHTVYKGANYNNYYTRRPGTEAIVNLYRVQSVYNNNVASREEQQSESTDLHSLTMDSTQCCQVTEAKNPESCW